MNGKYSNLGHLSKINGLEPAASLLRERFSSESLTVDGLNGLVIEYIRYFLYVVKLCRIN